MFGLFKRTAKSGWALVVVPEGEHKIHDVEAKLYAPGTGRGRLCGKLMQDRWSHGVERFRLRARNLPSSADGMARLFRDDELVSEFATTGGSLDFKWRGEVTDDMPRFEIGQKIRLVAGQTTLEGVVEPD